jgi:uncharacterized Fe-S cluster-containing radical SAM superfamily protein
MSPHLFPIPQLEMHVTHVCNLHCDGCGHYSNYGLKGMLSVDEAETWMRGWNRRVQPGVFKLLGGEPTLHPELARFVRLAAEIWPSSMRILTTNGFFLDRHPDLRAALTETGTGIHFSIHATDPSYMDKAVAALLTIKDWVAHHGLRVMISDNRKFWYRAYRGLGRDMRPHEDGDPQASWRACISKECMNLHDNRLWKCPPIAYLNLVASKFGLTGRAEWQPFLAYRGIGLDATDAALAVFVGHQAAAEAICGMCPVNPDHYRKDIYNRDFARPGVERVEARMVKEPAH